MNQLRENTFVENGQNVQASDLKQEPVTKVKQNIPERERVDEVNDFLKIFNKDGVVTKEKATNILPFFVYLAFLGMVYIANSHMAVRNIYKIDKLSKEVKDLRTDYQSLSAELSYKSQFSEVQKKVDTLGIKELLTPPQKIILTQEK